MNTRAEISDVLEGLISQLRSRSGGLIMITPVPIHRITDLIEECVDAQVKLSDIADDSKELLEFKIRVFTLEARINRLRLLLIIMPATIVIYTIMALTFFLITKVNIPEFIKTTLGVEAPVKLITLGIAGAFMYLATSLMTYFSSTDSFNEQFTLIVRFTIQLLLAIIVPVVLVALFFTKDGEISNIKVSPELLSFACGYSAKLVIDVFNKIVEKASKMIEAI